VKTSEIQPEVLLLLLWTKIRSNSSIILLLLWTKILRNTTMCVDCFRFSQKKRWKRKGE